MEQSKRLELLRKYIIFEVDKTISCKPVDEAEKQLDLIWKILMKLNEGCFFREKGC